jgi:hypothetical protein
MRNGGAIVGSNVTEPPGGIRIIGYRINKGLLYPLFEEET